MPVYRSIRRSAFPLVVATLACGKGASGGDRPEQIETCRLVSVGYLAAANCLVMKYDWNGREALVAAAATEVDSTVARDTIPVTLRRTTSVRRPLGTVAAWSHVVTAEAVDVSGDVPTTLVSLVASGLGDREEHIMLRSDQAAQLADGIDSLLVNAAAFDRTPPDRYTAVDATLPENLKVGFFIDRPKTRTPRWYVQQGRSGMVLFETASIRELARLLRTASLK